MEDILNRWNVRAGRELMTIAVSSASNHRRRGCIMTPEQIDLVRHSFDAMWPIKRKLAEIFYTRFFELAPDAKRLFPGDMERQHLKLMDSIAAIVGALDKRDLFQSIISHSGRQHAQFGARASHFVAFGDALIWGLETQFGPAFTPQLREAWTALYQDVASEMLRVAQPRSH
jgi:hemoglobin-like flavoprotein